MYWQMIRKYDTVIFDLDGTLLNTLDDLADSLNYSLRLNNLPERTITDTRNFVGHGVSRLVELSIESGTSNPKFGRCLDDFKNHYSGNMQNKTAAYEGINELLKLLAKKEYRLAVVSNKFDSAVKELCKSYFGYYIKAAFGESKDAAKKPAPDTLLKAVRCLESDIKRTVYVGDSEVDVKTAGNAGVPCIGAAWGFRGREALKKEGADYIIDKPMDLLEILE